MIEVFIIVCALVAIVCVVSMRTVDELLDNDPLGEYSDEVLHSGAVSEESRPTFGDGRSGSE